MTRSAFPFQADREVIEPFLRGVATCKVADAELQVNNGWLMVGPEASRWTVAWFDSAGSLTVAVNSDQDLWPTIRLINAILEMLGDDRRIEKEVCRDALLPTNKFFLDGAEVVVGAPFVLAGPMQVQAYRAKERE